MRKIVAALILFCLLPLGCADKTTTATAVPRADTPAPAVTTATTGTPSLDVPEANFNFGEMSEDNIYVHEFVIRNVGTGVLEIKKVIPG